MRQGLGVHWERMRWLPKSSKEIAICSNYKKNVYRRTYTEERPRVAAIFVAIIELFSSAEDL